MIRELGSDLRLPGVPDDNKKAPIEAAMPKQTVLTSQGMYCIVSNIAKPACTDPPVDAGADMLNITYQYRAMSERRKEK